MTYERTKLLDLSLSSKSIDRLMVFVYLHIKIDIKYMQIRSSVFRYNFVKNFFFENALNVQSLIMFRFNRKIYTIDMYEIINRYQI